MSRPIPVMLDESRRVLTAPSIETFEEVEKNGTKQDALQYVFVAAGVAAVAGALLQLLLALLTDASMMSVIGALIGGFVTPVAGFYIFAYLVHLIGKQQGGTGTEDEVFYTLALYTAPLLAITGVVSSIPVLNCLALPLFLAVLLYQVYLTYLAVRASMNLESTPAIITIVVAWVLQFIALAVIGALLAMLGLAA
nr:Yip1 family protein [Ardenticatena sp.]